jgi:CRP/FNR family transcriptional regulator, cyclic AMP receptor protein
MHKFAQILGKADIFYRFTDHQLDLVAETCQDREYSTGDIVFYERTKSDELYIIIQGIVDILVNPALVGDTLNEDIPAVTIATLHRGQSFGEIALVDQGLRSATARVAQDQTRLIIIPRDELIRVCENQPELGYQLMLNLAADLAFKIRSTDLRIREELLYGRKKK